MKIRRPVVTALLATAAVSLAAAPATAAPETAPQPVTYLATLADKSVVTTLDHGTFAVTEDRRAVAIRDTAGQMLTALPLTFSIDGQQLPVQQQISTDGRTLTLTPDTNGIRHDAFRPVASPLENQLAMNDLINAVSIGTSVGSLIGTAIGAVVGIGIGFALAGASCVILSLGCVVAVLPVVGLGGAVGGLTGLVLAGGPTAAFALYEYVTTLGWEGPRPGSRDRSHATVARSLLDSVGSARRNADRQQRQRIRRPIRPVVVVS
ncbi:hypothetical protein ACFQZZ_00470 [Nocardia sp. GCM10030253]|uniref:hypothetical protein n=1 Tax=Nocardia sp. GCM10030253 TaxID=3273404 RepID=UPI003628C3A5